jgi:hypothetical protein
MIVSYGETNGKVCSWKRKNYIRQQKHPIPCDLSRTLWSISRSRTSGRSYFKDLTRVQSFLSNQQNHFLMNCLHSDRHEIHLGPFTSSLSIPRSNTNIYINIISTLYRLNLCSSSISNPEINRFAMAHRADVPCHLNNFRNSRQDQ